MTSRPSRHGRPSAGRGGFERALEAARAIGLREIYVYALLGLAAERVDEVPPRAARLQGVSDAIAGQLGTSAGSFEGKLRERTLAKLRASSAEDVYLATLKYARTLSPDDAIAYALGTPTTNLDRHHSNVELAHEGRG